MPQSATSKNTFIELQQLDDKRKLIVPTMTQLADINEDRMYQTRVDDSTPAGQKRDADIQREGIINKFISELIARAEHQTNDAVTVCEIDGKLWLIDGYHRVMCYKTAGRTMIPTKVINGCDVSDALYLASTINLQSNTINISPHQRHEITWNALKTMHTGKKWKKKLSARQFALQFGVASSTMDNMVKAIQKHGPKTQLTWVEARRSGEHDYDQSVEATVNKWINQIDRLQLTGGHDAAVFSALVERLHDHSGQQTEIGETKETIVAEFSRYLTDPKAYNEMLTKEYDPADAF